ncbi:MAG: hypothetical protein A2W19_08400 [Spirochaetes bacterium RBG_16_49_21]|nr:MAG: hypothetical protein A2W19_08400 [Spirochaetes bacterium RBG_16_49_21]
MESIKGVLVGLVLFIAAFPVLWMNEGCAVKTAKGLDEGAKIVTSVKAETVDPANNGKEVHLSALATTDEVLADKNFGINQKCIKLIRNVEMYQWKEESHSEKKKKLGGGEETVTTYTYKKEWSSNPIDSSKFKKPGYKNPAMPYKGETFTANLVKLGAFRLSPSLISQITKSEPMALQQENISKLSAEIRGKARILDGGIFVGKNSPEPNIGDFKINYSIVKPQTVSVVAKQINDTFEAYATKQGTEINRLEHGERSAESMFQQMQKENTVQTWILRLVGLILMASGIGLIFRPLSTFGDVIPLIGSVLNMGIGIFAFIMGLVLSLITIAIAWIAHRPILGIAILVIGAGIFVAIWLIGKQKKAKAAV